MILLRPCTFAWKDCIVPLTASCGSFCTKERIVSQIELKTFDIT